VAPNGNDVYYLSDNVLWKLDIGTDSASLVRAGWCVAVALSPDGTRLALLGNELLLANISGAVIDTLAPPESVTANPIDVEFSHDGSHVFYSKSNDLHGADYYRVALDGTGHERMKQSIGSADHQPGHAGFALTPNDSILESRNGRGWPALSPTDADAMAYSLRSFTHGDMYLVRLSSGSVTALDCMPYDNTWTDYPSWFPDGRSLVFCADKGLSDRYELWMIESVQY
jgi:Tol biopolymer transport system component